MVDSALVLGPGGPVARRGWRGWQRGCAVREWIGRGRPDRGHVGGCDRGSHPGRRGDLARLAALPAPADPGGHVRTDPDRLAEVFATLGDPGLERAGACAGCRLL